MSDPAERFIHAAVAPLEDNAELQMMAAQELRGGLVIGPLQEHSDSLETAADGLEARRSGELWKRILYPMAAVAAVIGLVPVIRDFYKMRVGKDSLINRSSSLGALLPGPSLGGNPATRMPDLFGKLSPERRLLLFGDPSASAWPDRYRALWSSDGTNPMLFADYARAMSETTTRLPADFIATADLLDPDNGWFRHLAAGIEARDATSHNLVPYRIAKHGGRFPSYRITSPSGVAMALKLLAESAAAPRYDPYESELYRKRLDALPPGDDWVSRWLAIAYLNSHPPGSGMDRYHRDLAKVVAAESWVLASSGHDNDLAELAANWETCVTRILETPATSPEDVLSVSLGISIASPAIASAARELGLIQLAERHERWPEEVRSLNASRDAASENSKFRDLGGLFTNYLDAGLAVADDDLKPGRRADHAFVRRFLTAGWMGVYCLGALLFTISRYFRGYQPRRLSAALLRVLSPIDHGWILAGGVLMPFMLFLVLDQATPLGRQDHGLPTSLGSVVLSFMLAGAVMFWLPPLIASRRLGCRLGILGWDRGTCSERRLLRLAMGFLLLSGFASLVMKESIAVSVLGWLAILCFGGTLLFILATAFSTRRSAVRWLALARAALPAQVLAELLMALSSLVFHAREKHWIRNDRLSRIEPGIPAANRHQFELAEQMRNSLVKTIPPASDEEAPADP